MKKILLIILVFITAISCKKEDDSNPQEIIDEISQDVVLINESTNNGLIELNDDYLIFEENVNQYNSFLTDNILVSDIHPNAQNGYLRKIESIENINGNIKINTSQAQLVDAIINTDYETTYTVNNSDIIEVDESGEDIPNRNSTDSNNIAISFDINNKVIYDEDGNNSTTNDQITMSGTVELGFDIDFRLKIQNRQVQNFELIQNLSSTIQTEVGFDIEFIDINRQFIIKRFKLSPITVIVSGIPVVFTQWVVVLAGVDGSLSLGISYSAMNEFNTRYGIQYNRGNGWNTIFNINNEFTYDDGSTFNFIGEIEPHLQARYEVRPYGLSNARVSVYLKPSIKLRGEVNSSNPDYIKINTDWCFDSGARAQMNIFDDTVINFESSFFDEIPCYPLFSNIEPAKSPNPENGAIDIPINGLLSFLPGDSTPNESIFKIYFDTNPNPTSTFLLNSGVSSLNYSELQYDTTYYWKIETLNIDNDIIAESIIWQFTTEESPIILLSDYEFSATRFTTTNTLRNYSFSNDGLHLYMAIDDNIHHYILPSPFNLSDLSTPDEILVMSPSQGGSSLAEDVVISQDGTVLYVQADAPGGFNNDYFQQYTLNNPYSINSVSYIDNKELNYKYNKMEISPDNSKLYIAFHDFFSTISREIREFEFSTINDITSINIINSSPRIYNSGQSGGISYDITDSFNSIYVTDDATTGQTKKFVMNTPGDISSINSDNPQSTINLNAGERIIKVVGNEERFFTIENTPGVFKINEYIRN